MKLDFTPETLNKVVYQLQTVEQDYQKAKDLYEILEENEKDYLATLKVKISSGSDVSNVESETQARASEEWKDFKAGKYQAKKNLGAMNAKYKHLLRVMECVVEGMRYNSKLLMKNVHDIGGK
jgi:hypothetical protein